MSLKLIVIIIVSFIGLTASRKEQPERNMRPTAAYELLILYQRYTDQNMADTLKKFTIKVINQKIKTINRRITVNTIERLIRRDIGTNDVEYTSERLTWGGGNVGRQTFEKRRQQYVKREMQARRNYAIGDLDRERRTYTRYYRRLLNLISDVFPFQDTIIRMVKRGVGVIMQQEVELAWQIGCTRMKEKVRHLSEKWRRRHDREDEELCGIAVSDQELDRFYVSGGIPEQGLKPSRSTVDVPIYGGCRISETQRSVLTLPPKFTTYEHISDTAMEAEMEVMNCKLRWENMNKAEREGETWTKEWERERMEKENVYDNQRQVMDFKKMRVTELPTCRRIMLPEPQEESIEIEMRSMTQRLKDVVSGYKTEFCDRKGKIKQDNLSTKERMGLEECKNNSKEGEQIYMVTDKSKKMAVDSRENYMNEMKNHVRGDTQMETKDVVNTERVMSGHAIMWARMLKVGEDWRHWTRVKSAMMNNGGPIPPLYGMRKDHKAVPIGQEEVGPPARPVCGASKSPNGALSNILSKILDKLSDCIDEEVRTECRSTEEMVAEFNRINRLNEEGGEKTVFSMDVKALYPSLKADYVANVVSEMYRECPLEVEVDEGELALYLALVAERSEIEEYGLEDLVRKWRHEEGGRGRRPGITSAEVLGGESERRKSKFLPPGRKPNEREKNTMISLALKKGIQATMKNHLYMLDGKVYHQSEGGPIGLQLTGAIARTFMLWWDKKLMEKLREATKKIRWECHMYLRYVDDGNIVCTPFPPGSKIEGDSIVVEGCDDISAESRDRPADKRTAEIVKTIANTLCEFIQVEIDYPSAHEAIRMPILDLEVAVVRGRIAYRHYRKIMANPVVIHQRSAMPQNVKRACLTNEVIRMMRNTSRDEDEEVRKFFLSDFSHRMRMSGYPEQFRREIIVAGVRGYEKQVERNDKGECPLHRPKGFRKEERTQEKAIKKRAWYKPSDAVLFCPSTPEGELARRMRRITQDVGERTGLRVRVVERGGISIQSQLVRRENQNMCRSTNECVIHKSGDRGNCSTENIVYRGTCLTCKEKGISSKPDSMGNIVKVENSPRGINSVYIGETSRTCFSRGKEHLESMRNPNRTSSRSNAFVRHREVYHEGDEESEVKFKFEVVKKFEKPLQRQVWEGVEIHSSGADILMNSKLDHYMPAVGRMVVRYEP